MIVDIYIFKLIFNFLSAHLDLEVQSKTSRWVKNPKIDPELFCEIWSHFSFILMWNLALHS